MLQNMEFIQGFVEEAKTHVEVIESELVRMDVAAVDDESIHRIFRAAHSLKGTAGFFNLTKIVSLTHAMEGIFNELRNGRKSMTAGMADLLLSVNDCLKGMVEDVVNSETTDISMYMEKLDGIFTTGNEGGSTHEDCFMSACGDKGILLTAGQREKVLEDMERGRSLYQVVRRLNRDFIQAGTTPIELMDLINTIGHVIRCDTVLDRTDEEGGEVKDMEMIFLLTSVLQEDLLADALGLDQACIRAVRLDDVETTAKEHHAVAQGGFASEGLEPLEPKGHEPAGLSRSITVEDSVRVHVTLLNDLMNLASEMVLSRNQLMRALEAHRKSIPGIDPILQNLDHITTDLQEKIMQTRMQPVANVFSKFPRIIRELSKKLDKEIDLKLEGVDVELDKSIIEALGDPLTHLVRNAADHGLEMPQEREMAGKPRTGTILMKAYHEGGYVNIDIIDDGRGIHVDKVREKALQKNLIGKAEAASAGDLDILRLLFTPGFSTAERVTDVSGRGVGMDVVKTNIEKLGGTIEIFTAPGKGTTFRLLLPLTLAIIPSLIVEVENQKFALPQVNLQEIVRIKPGDHSRKVEYINHAEVLRLRGRLLPIVHLADVLGLNRTFIDPFTGERRPERRKMLVDHRRTGEFPAAAPTGHGESRSMIPSNVVRILVIKIGSRRLGIAVDAIHGSEEILVKPLPVHIKDCKCYSGVTILGDGKTVMILDPGGIIEKANLRFPDSNDEKKQVELDEENERMREQQNLLIFKCSGPESLAIDLSMVSRVEEIHASQIETIGHEEYIQFRGESMRIIRPEDFLPIGKAKTRAEKMYVIIPKLVKRKMGILIEKIHDTLSTAIQLKQDDAAVKGFVGSTILNNRIVLLVNIYELFEKVDPKLYEYKSSLKKGSPLTVLLAEDTPFFQKLEKSYLEDAGFQVMVASDGKEAWQMLQTSRIDAVLTDISMPVMDGLELVRKIRTDSRLTKLPVVAVTSLTNDSQVKKGMEAGFDAYEFKLDRARMLDVLEQAIANRRKAL